MSKSLTLHLHGKLDYKRTLNAMQRCSRNAVKWRHYVAKQSTLKSLFPLFGLNKMHILVFKKCINTPQHVTQSVNWVTV